MALDNIRNNRVYGMDEALSVMAPRPIVSRRNPTTNDKAPIGQMWVNRTTGIVWVLAQIVANSYNWYQAASVAVNLAVAGALTVGTTATIGTGLTVTAGGLTVTAGGATVTAGGLTVTAGGIEVTAGDCNLTFGNFTTVAGNVHLTLGSVLTDAGNLATTLGDIFTTAGGIYSTLGNITAVHGNIVATLGNIIATAGNITATLGNITATNGDIVISTATKGITLPGPVRIITGAGVPANGLAVNVGDMYINTTAAAINTRVYIATAAGAWTTLTTGA